MEYHVVFFFISIILQCTRPITSDELLAVTVVVNHGDTIPEKFYRTDPYQNPAIWEKPLGQLSNLGEQQAFAVGKWLKRRYDTRIPFLTLHYNASQIYTFSEDKDPSLMSAECIMAGLYPPVGDEVWDTKIHWRPTPVHTEPLFLDNIIGRESFCLRYEAELYKLKHGRYVRTHNKEDKLLFDYLSKHTGENFTNIAQIPPLFDVLTFEQDHNLTLPNWTHAVYPDLLAKQVLDLSIMRTKNPNITQLSTGPLLFKILQQFQDVLHHNPIVGNTAQDIRKFKIFVGNNSIIYDTLHGLKVPSVGIVPSGASLIFELWQANTQVNYVKLLYRPTPEINTPLQHLKIGGCKHVKCPYVVFNNTLQNIAVEYIQWNLLCLQ